MTTETENNQNSDILGMSDEDFAKLSGPEADPVVPVEPKTTPEAGASAVVVDPETPDAPVVETPAPAAEAAPVVPVVPAVETPDTPAVATADTPTPAPAVEPKIEAQDYEGFYKKVMAPFVANGKTIELRTPEEAIQLMQMGANYTRKMQSIAPHRKLLLMLENNGLLDESKLSFLIDIEKKNPEAIKKLVKDAGIDPMDIDTAVEPTYLGGNHQVSDDEANFKSALEDMKSTQPGLETLKVINSNWDQASKEVLWKNPEVMAVIQQQRELGVYDKIAAEVERQKTLGTIPAQMPFVEAYRIVGTQLLQAQPQTPAVTTPTAVGTTVAKPKPAATNGDKVSAASPTRSTPRKAESFINPLAMSDEEFMKQMSPRL